MDMPDTKRQTFHIHKPNINLRVILKETYNQEKSKLKTYFKYQDIYFQLKD